MQRDEIQILIKASTLDSLFKKVDNIESLLNRLYLSKGQTYTEQEACKILKMSLKTLQNLRKSRDIQFSRPPGKARKIIYTQEQIDNFLSKNEYNSNLKRND